MSIAQRVEHLLNSVAVETTALRYYFNLQKTQWSSLENLRQLQNRLLKSILTYAYENVPYYRRVFRERKLRPTNIRSVEDLAKLPIVTKDNIREHFDQFIAVSSRFHKPIPTATGGSTGEPLRFFLDARSAGVGAAVLWRGWGYAGYRLGDRMAVLAGLSLVSKKENQLRSAVKRVFRRTISLPAISMRGEILNLYARQILEFRPKFIRGYPSSIYFFADFLKDEDISEIRPKAVLTTAEMLLPHQRELIEEAFGCEVFDGYGAFDGGTAAFECEEHRGYHMATEKTVMEFVGEDDNPVGRGKVGRIVATDLCNYAMPFIRYDTGDLGVLSDELCPCGRDLPLMGSIIGRTTDVLKFKNGAIVSGPSLTLVFKDLDIKQYQVVQTSEDSVVIRIIKGRSYSEKDTEKVYQVLKHAVGDEVEVQFEFVDYIKPTKSGKWKFVISNLEQTN